MLHKNSPKIKTRFQLLKNFHIIFWRILSCLKSYVTLFITENFEIMMIKTHTSTKCRVSRGGWCLEGKHGNCVTPRSRIFVVSQTLSTRSFIPNCSLLRMIKGSCICMNACIKVCNSFIFSQGKISNYLN